MRSLSDTEVLHQQHLESVLDLWRAAGKRTVIQVRGGSMQPFMRPGQELVLDHTAARHPFGAVIVFLQGKMLVVHRVVGGSARRGYLTKGDAILHFDRGPVPADSVVGRVVALRQAQREQPFSSRRGLPSMFIALLSRCVGEVNRVCRALRWMSSPAGWLVGVIPGPTRILRATNRGIMQAASWVVGASKADRG